MRYTLLVAAVAATVATPALAQQAPTFSDTAQANAKGVVLQAHQLTKIDDLDFGVVTVDATGGTVSIAADAFGTRTTTQGVSALSGAFKAAEFLGEAAPTETVTLTLTPPANNEITSTNGVDKIQVVSLSLDSAGATRQAASDGKFTVYVGGTFQLLPNQPAGVYSDTFDLTAVYN